MVKNQPGLCFLRAYGQDCLSRPVSQSTRGLKEPRGFHTEVSETQAKIPVTYFAPCDIFHFPITCHLKKQVLKKKRTSLAVQWLGLLDSTVEGTGLILGWGPKFL